jgi:TPR repeat protein/predicted Zn-dependent protease
MASIAERTAGVLESLLANRVLYFGAIALLLLILFGAVPGDRVGWVLLLFVAARGAGLVREGLRRPMTQTQWAQHYEMLIEHYRGLEPEAREQAAAELGVDPRATPEQLALIRVDAQRLAYRPPRPFRELACEALGLLAFCLLGPFVVALYTREIVSFRSSESYAALGVAALCVALYLWPHRWKASEQRGERQALWWALPVAPALALGYLGVTTDHTYLDPRRPDRLELRAERVLALRNNVVAGAHADWVFDFARELERRGDRERAIAYYEKGVRLAPWSGAEQQRLAALMRQVDPGAEAAADPRPRAGGLTPEEFARLALWGDDRPLRPPPACPDGSQPAKISGTTVVLLRIGEVPASITDAIGHVVREELALPVCLASDVFPLPSPTRIRGLVFGRQWSAPSLLDVVAPTILEKSTRAPFKFLAITAVDIYNEGSNFVYSSAGPWGALLSYARYGDFELEPETVRHSVAKQALGALVKSFGVPTSPDPNCVTSYANGPEQFARKGNRPNAASFVLFRVRINAIDARWREHGTLGPEFYGHSGTDSAEAIGSLREAASRGDAHAQMLLGSSYALGKGVEKDLSEAEVWLRRAADQGNLVAHFQLATVYYQQRRFAEAAEVLRPAADRGLPQAQVMLATLYRVGHGVAVDPEESVRWLRRASDRGSADAQNNLGMAFLTGEGVARDPAESVVWFERAARQGQANAQFSLAIAYLSGSGVKRDMVRGLAWLEIAADNGLEPAVRERQNLRDALPEEIRVQAGELADRIAAELRIASSTHVAPP